MAYIIVVPHRNFRAGEILSSLEIKLMYPAIIDGALLMPCNGQWVSIWEYPELYDSLVDFPQKEIDGIPHRRVPDLRNLPE